LISFFLEIVLNRTLIAFNPVVEDYVPGRSSLVEKPQTQQVSQSAPSCFIPSKSHQTISFENPITNLLEEFGVESGSATNANPNSVVAEPDSAPEAKSPAADRRVGFSNRIVV